MTKIPSSFFKLRWQQCEDYHQMMESWIAAAAIVISANGIYLEHKKEILDTIVWKATESQGKPLPKFKRFNKWNARFISKRIYLGTELDEFIVNFEHVDKKKNLVDKLIESPNDISKILPAAKVCTITRDEHLELSKLSDEYDGWARYKEKKIDVYDRKENKLLKFSDPEWVHQNPSYMY